MRKYSFLFPLINLYAFWHSGSMFWHIDYIDANGYKRTEEIRQEYVEIRPTADFNSEEYDPLGKRIFVSNIHFTKN